MPTILRFRGFNIMIYTLDHAPAHVHARDGEVEAIFFLNCSGGPVEVRAHLGTTPAQELALARFIEENKAILCKAWEDQHGDSGTA